MKQKTLRPIADEASMVTGWSGLLRPSRVRWVLFFGHAIDRWQLVGFDLVAKLVAVLALHLIGLFKSGLDFGFGFLWILFQVVLREILFLEELVDGSSVFVTCFFLVFVTLDVTDVTTS